MALKDYLSHFTPKETPAYPADITLHVSADEKHPNGTDRFASIEAALAKLEAIRTETPEKSVTVRVGAGEYRCDGLRLTPGMSGSEKAPVTLVADGKCMINGGVSLKVSDFGPIPQEIKERLHGDAQNKVVVADLSRYGLTAADFGPVYPFGGFHTAGKYDGVELGNNCEVFFNGRRMTLSRWPNKGQYACLEAVADVGDCAEFPPQNYYLDWAERRNHRGGTYILSKADNARVETWKSYDHVWAFGYFFWDWADSTTPVTFDTAHRRFFPKFVSHYAARAGAEFYFFNVLDELDEPGEFWLDREKSLLYIYPYEEMNNDTKIEISIAQNPGLTIEQASYVTVDGFTFCNARDNGITSRGDHVTLRNCTICNVTSDGIDASGSYVLVDSCEVLHTGRAGIKLSGGERTTLTPGHCRAVNNYIHDFAEIYQTYAGGIHLGGVGNLCDHNEIADTPHAALFYSGNDLLIEYNYIHDVVKHSRDAGAVYSGQDWTQQGTVLRYNVLENVGTEEFKPQGIYWDDGLSGQTAYANLLVNVGWNAFEVGGGFDNHVEHNLIVNAGIPLQHDCRNRDGLTRDGWCHADVDNRQGRSWRYLDSMPIRSEVWAKRYPLLAQVREDLENREAWDDPHMPTNPAYGTMQKNMILANSESHNDISDDIYKFSTVENNPEMPLTDLRGFVNPADGDYRLTEGSEVLKLIPDFPEIPYEQIGRF